MHLTHTEIIRLAVEAVFDTQAALASMLAKLQMVADDKVITFATDGVKLLYSPAFVESGAMLNPPGALTIEETTWILIHELGHLFLGHHFRIGEKPERRHNIAADLALNSLMSQLGVRPTPRLLEFIFAPGKGNYESLPHGEDMEWYLSRLPVEPKQEKKPEPKPGEGKDGKPKDGGGAGDKPTLGEVQPHPAQSESDKKVAEQDWQETVAQAVNSAKSCGDLPGWLQTVAGKAYGQPVLDWRSALRRFMTQVAPTGTSWARPSRRQFGSSIIFPCNIATGAGEGLVLVDTSGSMSDSQCNVALRELSVILEAFPHAKVTMRQCDTRVIANAEKVFLKKDFPMKTPTKWFGRGGTDLRGAFAQARTERGKFKWMVIVSDMIWNVQQATNPGMPCIWLVTAATAYAKPSFGHMVFVK